MNLAQYLAALDARLQELDALIAASSIDRHFDSNLEIGFVKGQITFVDGSCLDFSEQIPTTRRKFRLHYMDAQDALILRWDSAPHHKDLSTFPFHRHTPDAIEPHGPMTLLEALGHISEILLP